MSATAVEVDRPVSLDLAERISAAVLALPERPRARSTAVSVWVRRWLLSRQWPQSDGHLLASGVLDALSPAAVAAARHQASRRDTAA